jgi:hypothetical protein
VREYIYLPEAEISPTMQSAAQVDRPLGVVNAVNTATVLISWLRHVVVYTLGTPTFKIASMRWPLLCILKVGKFPNLVSSAFRTRFIGRGAL